MTEYYIADRHTDRWTEQKHMPIGLRHINQFPTTLGEHYILKCLPFIQHCYILSSGFNQITHVE